jgi:4-amino-4-deoxy-L-arabinose transferase-like glycosyltransferase
MLKLVRNNGVKIAPPETTHDTPIRWARAETAFLICLAAAAFMVRLWPIWQVHFWDEAVYLQNAEVICCGKANYSELSSRPPLLSLLFAALFRIWHHVYAASILVAVLNALGPVCLYLGGRRAVGKMAAVIAAMLLAFSPFLVGGDTGNSLLTDSPALTLIVAAFWLLWIAGENDSAVWPALAGLVSAAAVLMRFASLPSVAILSLLLLRSDPWFRAAIRFAAGFVLGLAPYLFWSRIRYGGFLATLFRGWENVAGSAEPTSYYLRNFGNVFPWITVAGLLLWLVQFCRGFVAKKTGDRNFGDSTAVLWVWALVVFAYFSALTHKELRYILPSAPPLFLLAGQGLSTLLPTEPRRRVIGAAVLVLALAFSFAPDAERVRGPLVSPFVSEEKEVSDFLDTEAQSGAVLYTNFNYPVFGYYTHLPTRVLIEQGDSFYKAFPGNMPSDGYLVLYKELDKDPRLEWADSDPHFQRLQEFPSLVIYQYHASAR